MVLLPSTCHQYWDEQIHNPVTAEISNCLKPIEDAFLKSLLGNKFHLNQLDILKNNEFRINVLDYNFENKMVDERKGCLAYFIHELLVITLALE